ncbi:uncharacterized protein AKAW2_50158A [Aspergillus luchuensis]|uniref:Uncharacterized protein n=1 Tax=Aspergillus kawachii TaxID=1069201 RepID=A0A7R7ZZZ8_ASPKA|nr:uncharacterized protein AKAW2_50158A [Aspergillus luchuensis]BCR99816.1 hypothetical protein AKAW2_50158A [Aspergillus luchuensis]
MADAPPKGNRDWALDSTPTKLVRQPRDQPDAQQGSNPYPVQSMNWIWVAFSYRYERAGGIVSGGAEVGSGRWEMSAYKHFHGVAFGHRYGRCDITSLLMVGLRAPPLVVADGEAVKLMTDTRLFARETMRLSPKNAGSYPRFQTDAQASEIWGVPIAEDDL